MPSDPSNISQTLSLRPASDEDLLDVVQLILTINEAEGDLGNATSPEDLINYSVYQDFQINRDAFIIHTSNGDLVSYGALFNIHQHCKLSGDLFFFTDIPGTAAADLMLDALETRAREHVGLAPPGTRVYMQLPLDNKNENGKRFFVKRGYTPIRYYWRMAIELEKPPAIPVLPDGFEFRPFIRDRHAELIRQAKNEAFQNHWESYEWTFEEFSHSVFEKDGYDPSLWSVIWHGDEVAGFSINRFKSDTGWVQTLGVRPAYRSLGLGFALLLDSFSSFFQSGEKTIGLLVDASNPTGATRLYRKAGMQVVCEDVILEKELRPGAISDSLPAV
ncbi:MAG: GNAT family N-acetyltransferase [Anaerolineales bacterium]|nr:GNAT family N-acetyltransferase [Anaerolineales bacterium]